MLALSALYEGFARRLDIRRRMSTLSLSKGSSLIPHEPLPVPRNLAVKSRISISSKLIETKGLQVLYFVTYVKQGGLGVTAWYTPLIFPALY
jgi:hypothetical protein